MSELRRDGLCILGIGVWGLFWLVPELGHSAIFNWDESFHQVVTRNAAEGFLPYLYKDSLYPLEPQHWWGSGIFLHKPSGAFWLSALVLKVIGIAPVAVRITSLLFSLAAAVGIYVLAKPLAGRIFSTLSAAAFLVLPFGWALVQGYQFGDVTDVALAGCVTGGMVGVVRSARSERHARAWAVFAGVAMGVGYLVKTALALAPLGVATLLLGGHWLKTRRLPVSAWLIMASICFCLAAPWNMYSSRKWPEVYQAAAEHTYQHLFTDKIQPWVRPADGLLNEVNVLELSPLSPAVPLLAVIWLVIRAIRKRELESIAVAMWVTASWLVLSIARAKVPATAWGAVPGVFVALAVLLRGTLEIPTLAAATLGAVTTPVWIRLMPFLGRLRERLPDALAQTRRMPGLFEGLLLATVLALLVFALQRSAKASETPTKHWDWGMRILGALAATALVFVLLWSSPTALAAERTRKRKDSQTSYTQEVGRALDAQISLKSVLFLDLDREPGCCFEALSAMFWSGRVAYRQAPDLAAAQRRGLHSYILTPYPLPYEAVPGIPPQAWLRAYDAEKPMKVDDRLPEGAIPVQGVQVNGYEIMGYATGAIDSKTDRYAFFVRIIGQPSTLPIEFETQEGTMSLHLDLSSTLVRPERLTGAPWFILPTAGPPLKNLATLWIGKNKIYSKQ